jgi:polyhydroxybutyrate depolymerase
MSQTEFYSVKQSIRPGCQANGCKEESVTVKLPDETKVVLVAIEGMGHTWPGREPTLKFLGKSTRNVSANEMMWAFFERYPMK